MNDRYQPVGSMARLKRVPSILRSSTAHLTIEEQINLALSDAIITDLEAQRLRKENDGAE